MISNLKIGQVLPLANYRPISLLPICGKMFERPLNDEMFNFLITSHLISTIQSGFKPGHSCINQLLSITHGIYASLDEGYEVRGVFLDMSKVFYKVWHEGLIFKLEQNGIPGKLLRLIKDFLCNRKQRVVLNGQCSSWVDVQAGVPQASILGPLHFKIYINDLTDNLVSNPKLFADNTLFSTVTDPNVTANQINNGLHSISTLIMN